ncbi:MAG: glycosyltransferase [Comamonadaceae bacterium]|nr:glycosyltransferase [Comamonadaceae bacterium]
MRIVIDMQGAQSTGSRHRGIGRYSLALAGSIARQRKEHEIILVLNGVFTESVPEIREIFSPLLPEDCIRIWHPTGASAYLEERNNWSRHSSELLREAFIATLRPDMVLITSLFEGLTDDAVTSTGLFRQNPSVAIVLYDLIPLIHRDHYLTNPVVSRWYEEKLAYMRKADLHLAISASSREESIDHLNMPADAVVNISTAADPIFCPTAVAPDFQNALRERYGLSRSFVMYTGGIDYRKNIEGLIRAYALLPWELRASHQLAVVCSIHLPDRKRLQALAQQEGLAEDELILTGFVPEEDLLALYNLCKLFVFPSWHEGFGLPALEAMACGRAVIAANSSSLPEVVGCDDALFDPLSDQSIADKLQQVLMDDGFRKRLEDTGLKQAARFSWEKTAKCTIEAMEHYHRQRARENNILLAEVGCRPRLAYVSPLPPERSGIADYSAELLPALARYYEIDVILAQDDVSDSWVNANCKKRTIDWFVENASHYDRVVYHFGNSSYHQHMFSLLKEVPGTVVLHDFFLSGIIAHMDRDGIQPGIWTEALYASHGYMGLQHRFGADDPTDTIMKYPCNYAVLQNADGVIVHSEYARRLAAQWFGTDVDRDWTYVPLMRKLVETDAISRKEARDALGLMPDQFVVCSFGLLGPTKQNHRLLHAWLNSLLAKDERCVLVFVGENAGGIYGVDLLENIRKSECALRIRITGWADESLYRRYLHAADVGVQLRTLSRGETSAAVLDCMNHGLATIVNANGSMADLPDDAVLKLPDEFSDAQLIEALVSLYRSISDRLVLGARARGAIQTQHDPLACADLYRQSIERAFQNSKNVIPSLIQRVSALDSISDDTQLRDAARAIDKSIPPSLVQRQILVDVSELLPCNVETAVYREKIQAWLQGVPPGWRVEPIYFSEDEQSYRYARRFTLSLIGCPSDALRDEPVSYGAGDVLFGAQLDDGSEKYPADLYSMKQAGVHIYSVPSTILALDSPCEAVEGAVGFLVNSSCPV